MFGEVELVDWVGALRKSAAVAQPRPRGVVPRSSEPSRSTRSRSGC